MADPTRFTQHAAHAIHQAELEAKLLRSRSIEAEHLFLALCAEEAGVAADILRQDYHLDEQQVRTVVNLVSANFASAAAEPNTKPTLSTSLSSALFWAAQEARYANHHWVNTEHLLLGLVAANDRPMREIFRQLRLSPEDIRLKIHERVPEIPLQINHWAKLRDRFRTEFYHNFAYYVPQPIRKLFGRLDSSQMPPLG